ncbi:Rv3654c family TadE-like protein [Flexivirga oryzae]|uniref:Secretion/DNA translocation related TadE-like protein n=1 Tax=Flexivirga oryzae TaxID=1794944 RepID=A0A839N5L1_9MICO|nr:Rv3654c family TadE-like protein [Flexivirga oryzae]MBB2893038.1 secretion/DNA translocation related TadE-like protein [Flexivirga oryzae]
MSAGERERGSGTVLVVSAIGVLALLLGAAMALVSAVSASHRARAAADLAALAAADALVHGRAADPCAVAGTVAARNGSTVLACVVGGAAVTVTVATAPGWPGLGPARAGARAGPSP